MDKEKIKIEGELTELDLNIEDVENKINQTALIKDIRHEVILLKKIEAEMNQAEKEFDNKVKEAKRRFNNDRDKLFKVLDMVKVKAIKEAQETMEKKETFKNIVDEETGEMITTKDVKRIYHLPKGFTYKKAKVTYDYDETKLDDKYFKIEKKVKKNVVKDAIANGELDAKIAIPKVGEPSLSIDYIKVDQGLLEDKEGEKNE